MALPKAAVTSPQIYVSDPVEQALTQAFAKSGPAESGPLYLHMSAARDRNEAQAEQYRSDVQDANKMALMMAAQEQRAKAFETAMKEGWHYTDQGFNVNDIPALAANFGDANSASVMEPSNLARLLKAAEIRQKNAQASKDASSGGPKIKMISDVDQYGNQTNRYEVTGPDGKVLNTIMEPLLRRDVTTRGNTDPGEATPRKKPGGTKVDAQAAGVKAALDRYPGAQ